MCEWEGARGHCWTDDWQLHQSGCGPYLPWIQCKWPSEVLKSHPGMRGFQQAIRCECHHQVERQAFGCRQGKSPSRRKIRSPVHTTGWFANMQRKQRANKISSPPCPVCGRPPGTELEPRRLFLSVLEELPVKHGGGKGNFNILFHLSKRGWWAVFQMLAIIFK